MPASTIRVEAMETTEAVAGADIVIPDSTVPDAVSMVLAPVMATTLAFSFPADPVKLQEPSSLDLTKISSPDYVLLPL